MAAKSKEEKTTEKEATQSPESTPPAAPTETPTASTTPPADPAPAPTEATQELMLEFGPVMLGDTVLYVMPNGKDRPAIVVQVWSKLQGPHEGLPIEGGICNLQVFTDGSNDQDETQSSGFNERVASGLLWATSVRYSESRAPGTWHWIEA